jgi:hypothetical protein
MTCVFPPVLALLPMRLGGCDSPLDRNHLTRLQLLYFSYNCYIRFSLMPGIIFIPCITLGVFHCMGSAFYGSTNWFACCMKPESFTPCFIRCGLRVIGLANRISFWTRVIPFTFPLIYWRSAFLLSLPISWLSERKFWVPFTVILFPPGNSWCLRPVR